MDIKDKTVLKILYSRLNSYPDFPREGVIFKDIMDLLYDQTFRSCLVDYLVESIPKNVTCIVAPESRGFLLGPLVAHELDIHFVPIRKKGKLPGEVRQITYDTEYSTDTIEIKKDSVSQETCWFIDDIYATGGTYQASKDLIRQDGGFLIGGTTLLSVLGESPEEIIELFKEVKDE